MGWNELSYWLKGGIISIVVLIIISAFIFIPVPVFIFHKLFFICLPVLAILGLGFLIKNQTINIASKIFSIPSWLKGAILGMLLWVIFNLLFLTSQRVQGLRILELTYVIILFLNFLFPILGVVPGVFVSLILYGCVGALIGWIYGKIKNRKQE